MGETEAMSSDPKTEKFMSDATAKDKEMFKKIIEDGYDGSVRKFMMSTKLDDVLSWLDNSRREGHTQGFTRGYDFRGDEIRLKLGLSR